MVERIYSFLGLATKAGKLISGEDACERTMKSRKVYLVIVAEDASDNTKKKFTDMCRYRNITMIIFGQKDLLGKYTGKDVRTVTSITDRRFAARLQEMIDEYRIKHGGV